MGHGNRTDSLISRHQSDGPREAQLFSGMPNTLALFMKFISQLLGAQGWMLLHRTGSSWKVVASQNMPRELHLMLLSDHSSRDPEASASDVAARAIGDEVPTGHVLDIGIGHRERPRYRCVLRRSDSQKPFQGQEIEALVRSLPQVARLLSFEERMRSQQMSTERALLAGHVGFWLLDRIGVDICLVDQDLQPVFGPDSVKDVDDLTLNDGRVAAKRPEDNRKLLAAVANSLNNRTYGVCEQGVSLGNAENHKPILVSRVDVVLPHASRRMAAILLPRQSFQEYDPEVIRSMFGLTRVEAAVVKLLCDGLTPVEAAQRMRVSPNTLRGYVKVIFRKLNVHRQSDLIRMMAATAGLLRGGGTGKGAQRLLLLHDRSEPPSSVVAMPEVA